MGNANEWQMSISQYVFTLAAVSVSVASAVHSSCGNHSNPISCANVGFDVSLSDPTGSRASRNGPTMLSAEWDVISDFQVSQCHNVYYQLWFLHDRNASSTNQTAPDTPNSVFSFNVVQAGHDSSSANCSDDLATYKGHTLYGEQGFTQWDSLHGFNGCSITSGSVADDWHLRCSLANNGGLLEFVLPVSTVLRSRFHVDHCTLVLLLFRMNNRLQDIACGGLAS